MTPDKPREWSAAELAEGADLAGLVSDPAAFLAFARNPPAAGPDVLLGLDLATLPYGDSPPHESAFGLRGFLRDPALTDENPKLELGKWRAVSPERETQLLEQARRELDEHRKWHKIAETYPAFALQMSLALCVRWMDPFEADALAKATIDTDAEGFPLPAGANRDDAIKALSAAVLYAVMSLPGELAPKAERPADAELDEWAARSAAEDEKTDAGILWLSERLAAKIETIGKVGTDREAARDVAVLWRKSESKQRRKVINGNGPRGYLFTGWGVPGALATDINVADRAAVWPPVAWRYLAHALWRAEVRPPLAFESVKRGLWPHPVLLSETVNAVARRDDSAWAATGPTMDANTLTQVLAAIQGADGRAVLRALPWASHEGACCKGSVAIVWADGPYQLTAESVANSQTLVRAHARKDAGETLRRALRLSHDADPIARLRELTTVSLDFTLSDGSRNTGPLVSDVDVTADGATVTFLVSRTMHPGVAGKLVERAVLVPVLRHRPPAYHPRASAMLDSLELAMLHECAMMAPRARHDIGAPLDIDGLLGEYGGPAMARTKGRAEAAARLGLDGTIGLWTESTDGLPPRWIVTRAPGGALYYLPGDVHAATVLRDGWKLRQGAGNGVPPPSVKQVQKLRARKAAASRRPR